MASPQLQPANIDHCAGRPYLCESCTLIQETLIEAERARCTPTCVTCERRPPVDEGKTQCQTCLDSLDSDDSSKRRRMTPEERARAADDRLSGEVAPPVIVDEDAA